MNRHDNTTTEGGTSRRVRIARKVYATFVFLNGLLLMYAAHVWASQTAIAAARYALVYGTILIYLGLQIWRAKKAAMISAFALSVMIALWASNDPWFMRILVPGIFGLLTLVCFVRSARRRVPA